MKTSNYILISGNWIEITRKQAAEYKANDLQYRRIKLYNDNIIFKGFGYYKFKN